MSSSSAGEAPQPGAVSAAQPLPPKRRTDCVGDFVASPPPVSDEPPRKRVTFSPEALAKPAKMLNMAPVIAIENRAWHMRGLSTQKETAWELGYLVSQTTGFWHPIPAAICPPTPDREFEGPASSDEEW